MPLGVHGPLLHPQDVKNNESNLGKGATSWGGREPLVEQEGGPWPPFFTPKAIKSTS